MWQKSIQGHVLGAFFYGYLISQIPGGILAERYGGKWVLAVFVCISTAGTLLTPIAARLSFIPLIILRILCGVGSVCSYCNILFLMRRGLTYVNIHMVCYCGVLPDYSIYVC